MINSDQNPKPIMIMNQLIAPIQPRAVWELSNEKNSARKRTRQGKELSKEGEDRGKRYASRVSDRSWKVMFGMYLR